MPSPKPHDATSRIIKHNNFGMIPRNSTNDINGQIRQVESNGPVVVHLSAHKTIATHHTNDV